MTDQQQRLAQQIQELIDTRVDGFSQSLTKTERDIFNRVLELSAQLEKRKDGTIIASVNNVRLVSQIKQEIIRIVNTPQYRERLQKLVDTFEGLDNLQQRYFATLVSSYTTPVVLQEIRKLSVESITERMDGRGLGTGFANQVRDILTRNITSGGKFTDFVEQIRGYLVSTETSEGALTRYAKTVTVDAVNQYNAQYLDLVSQDLGLEWYNYTGALKETSRPFCRALIEAKDGCMPYIHRSQLPQILKGVICGEQTPLNKKTGLPVGMIDGTNESNFQILRGGYGCRHKLWPVSGGIVPKELRAKFE